MTDLLTDHEERVLRRVDYLRNLNTPHIPQRTTIRAILDGGSGAVRALLGNEIKEQWLPVANYIDSGLNKLARRLGRAPAVKVVSRRDRDNKPDREAAEKIQAIVEGYDRNGMMDLDLPQAARWIAGYGFCVWVIRNMRDYRGVPYPKAELRDPFDCYPGPWGPDQQPKELAIARRVDTKWLESKYPGYRERRSMARRASASEGRRSDSWGGIGHTSGPGWETSGDGTVVVEYYDGVGTWVIAVDVGMLLEFVPNKLRSGPRFVAVKRMAFNRLLGHYDHSLGLMRMIATVNMLAVIATQDGTLRETNIIGELESGTYKFGRRQVNRLAPGSRIERPTQDVAFGAFQEATRLEDQLRVVADYPRIQDAQPGGGWVTGQGLDRLGSSGDDMLNEYQLSLGYGLQTCDFKRLEHDDLYYPSTRKPLIVNLGDESVVEHYVPAKDIKGQYLTDRVYGVMASFDDASKVVGGLQLLQARIIDRRTFQENLHGLKNTSRILERIDQDRAFDALYALLEQRGSQGDPAAEMALVQIALHPQDRDDILAKIFTAEEPEMSPEEMMLLQGGMPGSEMGGDEMVGTVLSRLEAAGAASGGSQTVGRL